MENSYDFSSMSDEALAIMQHDCRAFSEDKKFVNAILEELGKRQKLRENCTVEKKGRVAAH